MFQEGHVPCHNVLNRWHVLDGNIYACNIMACHWVGVLGCGTFLEFEYISKILIAYTSANINHLGTLVQFVIVLREGHTCVYDFLNCRT